MRVEPRWPPQARCRTRADRPGSVVTISLANVACLAESNLEMPALATPQVSLHGPYWRAAVGRFAAAGVACWIWSGRAPSDRSGASAHPRPDTASALRGRSKPEVFRPKLCDGCAPHQLHGPFQLVAHQLQRAFAPAWPAAAKEKR